jgi:hypothetical protein
MVEMIEVKVRILVTDYCTMLSKALKIHCVCQYIVPRKLMQEQHDDCMRMSDELIKTADNCLEFLQKIAVGGEPSVSCTVSIVNDSCPCGSHQHHH